MHLRGQNRADACSMASSGTGAALISQVQTVAQAVEAVDIGN
jgi:hypothetical protein